MNAGSDFHPPKDTSNTLLRPTGLVLALMLLVAVAYVMPAIALALTAIIVVIALAWLRPFWVFAAILAFIPLYDGVQRTAIWVLQWPSSWVTLLSLWKEAAIGLLFAVLILQHLTGRRRLQLRLYQFDLWMAALLLLAAVYILVAAGPGIGIFGFRNYVLPLSLFYLARLLPYSRRELAILLVLLGLVAAGVAAFGIYQAQFIDFAAMVRMGYVEADGTIPFAFRTALRDGFPRPRAVSTATGPNQLAVYLTFFILLAGYAILYRNWRRWDRLLLPGAFIALLGICMLLTFSRGGMLALMSSVFAWALIQTLQRGVRRTWQDITGNRWLMLGLVLGILLVVAGLVASGFATRVIRGLTGRDPAADAHVSSTMQSIDYIARHPLGVGMGMVGERALQFAGEAEIQHTESSYFQFAMETGIFGMVLLLIALVSLLATLWRLRRRRLARSDLWGLALTELALVFWFGAMVDFIVTPLLQNLLAAGHLWFIAGVAFHLDTYGNGESVSGEW